ncbi:MAG: nodulation protein NfeD [Halobacteriota archaeon]|nr:nodulation protein NfeD [Halobacteriota archaeon]
MKRLEFIVIVLLILSLSFYAPAGAAQNTVYVISIEGTITTGTALDVSNGIEEAIEINADAILIELNTPGGLIDAMDDIIEEIENSPKPIITFVPKGAKSFSAGAFILLSGHISAMSKGSTSTGAATPISLGITGDVSSVENKTVNAYAARMRGIAQSRNRDVDTAEKFVTEGLALSAEEALEANVIDLIVDDRDELIKRIDGRTVEVGEEGIILNIEDAEFRYQEVTLRSGVIKYLGNPQIAFILFMVGLYGLIFGFMSPGTYVPEMIGIICLILALYGMGFFEVNVFGIVLIIAAIILFVAEALTPTFGILTAGGIVCLILGAFMFIPSDLFISEEWIQSFKILVYSISIVTAGFFIFALTAVLKLRKQRSTTGTEELLDKIVKAETDIAPEGTVRVRGEIWNVKTKGEHIKRGEEVKIIDRDGLTLIVEKTGEEDG